jgi:signal transduction histidine kinase
MSTSDVGRTPRTRRLARSFQRISAEPNLDGLSPLAWAERRALRLLALHEVALTIGGQSDPGQTLDLILAQARSLLGAPAGSICTWEEASRLLRCNLAHNVQAQMLNNAIRSGEGAAGVAFRDCKTVLINNYANWANAATAGPEAGVTAAVGVPLRIGDRLLGALTVHTYEAGQTFGEEDAWLLELLGDQAAIALEQARLVEHAERRAANLLALHSVFTAISAQADVGTTLDLILSQAAQLLKRELSLLYLWDEPTRSLVVAGQHGLLNRAASLVPGQGLVGQVWLEKKPLMVNDYAGWEHALPGGREVDISAAVGAPLVVAGRPLGVLAVFTTQASAPFSAEEVQILELFAGQAAVAIENARLFDMATQARAMEELDRLKSEFISTVSHELRTPLTYIQGYAELLRERQFEAQTFEQVIDEIHSASIRMGRLVDDLLDLSRLEAGRLELVEQDVHLGELLENAVAAARLQAPQRQFDLKVDRLPTLTGDPDRLRQVVDNLLSNAQRYAPSGSITVQAEAHDGGVRVQVIDQGPGIPTEDQSRVFEPFYRGARSVVLPLRGGGLGLAIVRRLVEAHGGRVGVKSRRDQGSAFWFTLPLARTQDSGVRSQGSAARQPSVPQPSR